jgi:hypothetical protein
MDRTVRARILLATIETELALAGLRIPEQTRLNIQWIIENSLALSEQEGKHALLRHMNAQQKHPRAFWLD